MARGPRKRSSNGIYHIMLRGINKQTIFEDDEDRLKLLDTIKRYKRNSGFQLYAYCLMDNHIHLLIREVNESISKTIQRISTSYVYWYNEKYDRYGHLFQGRFKSENVDSARYFLTVLRYIHQNPVKAGIAANAFACQWTSLYAYYHITEMVDTEFALQLFAPDNNKATQMFTDYMLEVNEDECMDDHVHVKMSDSDVRTYLTDIGIPASSTLQQLDKIKRDAILAELKDIEGISIRQLSRITGISKSIIDRAR